MNRINFNNMKMPIQFCVMTARLYESGFAIFEFKLKSFMDDQVHDYMI